LLRRRERRRTDGSERKRSKLLPEDSLRSNGLSDVLAAFDIHKKWSVPREEVASGDQIFML
jgi:hypothetical protein